MLSRKRKKIQLVPFLTALSGSLFCLAVGFACSAHRENTLNLLDVYRAEEHVLVTAACYEMWWFSTDQTILYPDELWSATPELMELYGYENWAAFASRISEWWDLSEKHLRGNGNINFFIRNFDAILPCFDNNLPPYEVQLEARIDPFAPNGGRLLYWACPTLQWYLIGSRGPDGDIDMEYRHFLPDAEAFYFGRSIAKHQYDPTNGLDSSGDLWFWRSARWRDQLAFKSLYEIKYQKPGFHLWELRE